MPGRKRHPSRDRAVEMVRSGRHPIEVAPELNCSYNSVLVWCREAGVVPAWKGGGMKRCLTPDQAKEVVRLFKMGTSRKVIAERFGISRPTVSNYLKRAKKGQDNGSQTAA